MMMGTRMNLVRRIWAGCPVAGAGTRSSTRPVDGALSLAPYTDSWTRRLRLDGYIARPSRAPVRPTRSRGPASERVEGAVVVRRLSPAGAGL